TTHGVTPWRLRAVLMKIRTSIKTGNPTSWQGLVVRSSLNFYTLLHWMSPNSRRKLFCSISINDPRVIPDFLKPISLREHDRPRPLRGGVPAKECPRIPLSPLISVTLLS
ncbi:hypothetical protein, partial [Burkholderia gladioli]|uniref:hypothetical protein n=1 Tax=Burkholderia gladioli TaxID=28095 RepID=UPI001ABA317E